jgi:hypothetical protein
MTQLQPSEHEITWQRLASSGMGHCVIWRAPTDDLKDWSAFQTSATACKKTQHHISEDLNFPFATTLLSECHTPQILSGTRVQKSHKLYNGRCLLHLQHLHTMPCWQAPLQQYRGNGKGYTVSVHTVQAYRANASTDPLILRLSMSWRSEVSFMAQLLRPQWQNYQYPLGGPHSYAQCLKVKNLLTWLGIERRIIHPARQSWYWLHHPCCTIHTTLSVLQFYLNIS